MEDRKLDIDVMIGSIYYDVRTADKFVVDRIKLDGRLKRLIGYDAFSLKPDINIEGLKALDYTQIRSIFNNFPAIKEKARIDSHCLTFLFDHADGSDPEELRITFCDDQNGCVLLDEGKSFVDFFDKILTFCRDVDHPFIGVPDARISFRKIFTDSFEFTNGYGDIRNGRPIEFEDIVNVDLSSDGYYNARVHTNLDSDTIIKAFDAVRAKHLRDLFDIQYPIKSNCILPNKTFVKKKHVKR